MSRFHPRHLVLAALACHLAGCGALPTQPQMNPGPDEALLAGTMAAEPTEIGDDVMASAVVNGRRGGSVEAGIFRVVVPPGAFRGEATILVRQPDPAQPLVELSIDPASKNSFRVPVTLVARLGSVAASRLATGQVTELDPATGGWMPMSGEQADTAAMTLSTPLLHFSTYRVEFPAEPGAGSSPGTSEPPARQPTFND